MMMLDNERFLTFFRGSSEPLKFFLPVCILFAKMVMILQKNTRFTEQKTYKVDNEKIIKKR